jgi:hypothetical protein
MQLNMYQSASPDGQWIAEGLVATSRSEECCGEYYTRLSISSADGSTERQVVDEWRESGLGSTTPRPFHWSNDGRYFYYTNLGIPDGCPAFFYNGNDLYRVDLRDGITVQIIPSSGAWLSISPDETTLAYVGYVSSGLILHDLDTGEERESSIDPSINYIAGHILWSPNSTALVLTLALKPDPCSERWAESTSILLVDADTLGVKILIEADARLFITDEWPKPEVIVLKDKAGDIWSLNLFTGELDKND